MLENPVGKTLGRSVVLAAFFSVVVAAFGCRAPAPDIGVLDQELQGQVVFATTNCEIKNAAGLGCDRKTCKADSASNCEYFGSRCLATGHKYTGTKDAGVCTREPGGQ